MTSLDEAIRALDGHCFCAVKLSGVVTQKDRDALSAALSALAASPPEEMVEAAALAIAENDDVVLVNMETDEVTVIQQNVNQARAALAAAFRAVGEKEGTRDG